MVRVRAGRDAFTAGTRWIYNFKRDSIVLLPSRIVVGGVLAFFPWQIDKIHVFFVVGVVGAPPFGFVPFSKTESLNSLCLAFIYSICALAAIILWPLADHEDYVQWKCYRRHVSCTLPSRYYRFFRQHRTKNNCSFHFFFIYFFFVGGNLAALYESRTLFSRFDRRSRLLTCTRNSILLFHFHCEQ